MIFESRTTIINNAAIYSFFSYQQTTHFTHASLTLSICLLAVAARGITPSRKVLAVLCAENLTCAAHANVDLLLLAANATAPAKEQAV